MTGGLPKVFLGSSLESVDVIDAIKEKLRSHAEVVAWNDDGVFPPGQYFLDSLLGLVRSFDFAVLVFGPDDELVSRGQRAIVPRDNVVFELGAFMNQLDRPRTFILRPSGTAKYRILTDLSGLTLLTYVPHPGKRPTTILERRDRALFLDGSVKNACVTILEAIAQNGRRKSSSHAIKVGPQNVLDVGNSLFDLIDRTQAASTQAASSALTVLNIAHDMGVTWPLIKTRLVDDERIRNLRWRTIMVNPDADQIKKAAGAGISIDVARSRIHEIVENTDALDRAQRERKVTFGCRTFSEPPRSHGFLLNTDTLFLTMSKLRPNGKLESASNPYWIFTRDAENPNLSQPIDAFQSWFEYAWKVAEQVR
jgi:hypothetical protein